MLSVIIPVYNEERTLRALLGRVQNVPINKEMIIVDDGSTDGTRDILKSLFPNGTPGGKVLFQDKNKGKGAAIRTGLEHVRGDVIVVQDADLEYDPANYLELLRPFGNEDVHVVFGSRFMETGLDKFLRQWWGSRFSKISGEKRYLSAYLGVRLLNFLTYLLYGLKTTDQATCYKLLRAPLMRSLDLQSTGFEFCTEVTAKVGRRGLKVVEVPISYCPRTFEEGKKLKILRDGWGAVWTLVKYRLGRS